VGSLSARDRPGGAPGARRAGRLAPFGIVGAIGLAVQVSLVAVLTRVVRLDVVLATAVAVEATILHNFAWHERWTWADHSAAHAAGVRLRLVRFNLVALGTLFLNVAITAGLFHLWSLPAELANLVAVLVCSALNYAAIEGVVLLRRPDVNA
jgi:putative flippase GtrA